MHIMFSIYNVIKFASMETKQTAVEWLISQLQKTRNYQRVINEANESGSSVMDVIEQANKMFEQQIMDACEAGFNEGYDFEYDNDCNNDGYAIPESDSEGYYNRTYNNGK